jgi:hypothetical protein
MDSSLILTITSKSETLNHSNGLSVPRINYLMCILFAAFYYFYHHFIDQFTLNIVMNILVVSLGFWKALDFRDQLKLPLIVSVNKWCK